VTHYTCKKAVTVLDGTRGGVNQNIPLPYFASAIAINPQTGYAYVSSFQDDVVMVLDAASGKVIASVSVSSPNQLALNPNTNRVYIPNTQQDTVSVMDGVTNRAMGTVALPAGSIPMKVAVNPATNTIYCIGQQNLYVIDGRTNALTDTVNIVCPTNLVVNPRTNLVYITAENSMLYAVDGVTNRITGTLASAFCGVPLALAVAPDTNTVYVTTSVHPDLYRISGNTLQVLDVRPLEGEARDMAVDSCGGLLYIVLEHAEKVLLYDMRSGTVTRSIPVDCPYAIAAFAMQG